MNAAISPVHATIPSAIHDALPPTLSSGLSEVDAEPFPSPNPDTTAAASTTTAAISSQVMRLIGVRVSRRSVRYQWPSKSPSRTAPVNSAPARSWKTDSASGSPVSRANATSMATASGTVRRPRTRAAVPARRAKSTSHSSVPAARATASHTAGPDPAIPGARELAEAAAAPAARATTIPPVRRRNPRRTSFHRGERNRTAAPPAADSARTNAMTPPGPLTPGRPLDPSAGYPIESMGLFRRKERRPPARVAQSRSGSTASESDWRSFDSVAETYARLIAPNLGVVAEDLVKLLEVAPGQRVLDVGTGTGVGARAAARAAGEGGVAVGIDPSIGMLRMARRDRAHESFAAATSIDLPF